MGRGSKSALGVLVATAVAAAVAVPLTLAGAEGEPQADRRETSVRKLSVTPPPTAFAAPPRGQSALPPRAPEETKRPGPRPTPQASPSPETKKKPRKLAPLHPTASRFAGRKLAVYKGPMEPVAKGFKQARPKQKRVLKYLHNRPKMLWMGPWIKDRDIYAKTKAYIRESQRGNPQAVVQLAVFRLEPWYTDAREGKPTKAQRKSYKRWVRNQVRAIGSTPAIVVLQPDMPFLMTAKHAGAYESLLRWAAKQYGSLPRTRLYLEAGSGDWPSEGQGGAEAAVDFLLRAGIHHADGVALGSTHYYYVEKEVERVAELVTLLRERGVEQELKGVINTSSNGNPWDFGAYQYKGVADEAPACKSKADTGRTCVSLGIPPTFDVSAAKWGLSPATNALAAEHVDAYLWIGRPWLHMQASPFKLKKALALVRSSPYSPF